MAKTMEMNTSCGTFNLFNGHLGTTALGLSRGGQRAEGSHFFISIPIVLFWATKVRDSKILYIVALRVLLDPHQSLNSSLTHFGFIDPQTRKTDSGFSLPSGSRCNNVVILFSEFCNLYRSATSSFDTLLL